MLLALVFSIHAATASPNPCSDQMSMLCRISPFFCPSAYPANLTPGSPNVPCWPTAAASRDTRVVQRPSGSVKGQSSVMTKRGPAPDEDARPRPGTRIVESR